MRAVDSTLPEMAALEQALFPICPDRGLHTGTPWLNLVLGMASVGPELLLWLNTLKKNRSNILKMKTRFFDCPEKPAGVEMLGWHSCLTPGCWSSCVLSRSHSSSHLAHLRVLGPLYGTGVSDRYLHSSIHFISFLRQGLAVMLRLALNYTYSTGWP